jgi:ankyrin repeat protein
MTTRMTAPRLCRLISAGDADAVRTAVDDNPRLLSRTVERDGDGGWTPLHVAVAEDQEAVVRLLVERGADLSVRTDHDRTPLHVALEYAPGMVVVLRQVGAPVDAASAAFLDDVDELSKELDRGAHLVDPVTGADLLAFAAAGGAVSAARMLLERGADPDGGALHAAAARASAELVRLLVESGADVERRDPETGRTPLHAAVAAGPDGDAPDVVRILLEGGADVDAVTNDGASALDISRVAAARSRSSDAARATGHDALAELLVAHGATG